MDIQFGLNENFKNYIKAFFENDYRYYAIYGARDSGKSFTTAIIVLWTLLNYRNVKFVLARNFQTEVTKSQFQQICDVITHFKLQPYFKVYGGAGLGGTKRILCKITGSYTINVGTKEPQTMKSLAEITHAWIEEADQISELGLIELQQVVRSDKSGFKNKTILTFNPCAKTKWIYKRFFNGTNTDNENQLYNEDGTRKDTYYNFSSFKDNRYITQAKKDEIEELKYVNEILYQRYTLGNFVDEEFGKVFTPNMIIEYGGGSMGKGVVYVDPAYKTNETNDYTAIVKASSDKSYIYIEDVFIGRIEYEGIVAELKKLMDYDHRSIGYDGFGQQDTTFKNELKHNDVEVRHAYPIRLYADSYVETMLRLFASKRILFSKKVIENRLFMEQLYNFTSKKDSTKDSKHDDGVDALFGAVWLLTELGYFKNR